MKNLQNSSSTGFCCEFVGLLADMVEKGDDNSRVLAEDIMRSQLKNDLYMLYFVKPARVQIALLKLFFNLIDNSPANLIIKVVENDEFFVQFFLDCLKDDASSQTLIILLEILYILLDKERDYSRHTTINSQRCSVVRDYFNNDDVSDKLVMLQQNLNKDVSSLAHNMIVEYLEYFEE